MPAFRLVGLHVLVFSEVRPEQPATAAPVLVCTSQDWNGQSLAFPASHVRLILSMPGLEAVMEGGAVAGARVLNGLLKGEKGLFNVASVQTLFTLN